MNSLALNDADSADELRFFGCDGTPPIHNPITTELRERAVSSTNLANLPDTLERIASYHRDMNTGIELCPGASDSAIDDLEALLGW